MAVSRFLVLCSCLFATGLAQQTLKISATLTVEKGDDKVKTHEHAQKVLAYAREQKLEGNIIRFLQNAVDQTSRMMDAMKTLEEQASTEVPKEFSPKKYKVKSIPKLSAKKSTVKKISAKDLRTKLQAGQQLNFDAPMLVSDTTALLSKEDWENQRRHWAASRIMSNDHLENNLRLEYWPPDKARMRLVGANELVMEEPEAISFSRWLTICFLGSPAKPKLPGQNTEHCEQTVDAASMVQNRSELKALDIFPELGNALPVMVEFRQQLMKAAGASLQKIFGDAWKQFKKGMDFGNFRFFTFGPSGSGDKLHEERGLPFYDILIHGSRRWLLMPQKEMERVAVKAREALEFDKTSAYMFFEEKLPELKEEFGLKKYVEINQNPGDLVISPPGWYRVSLSLADSISYMETVLSDDADIGNFVNNQVWNPNMRVYNLAFCYDRNDLQELVGDNQRLEQFLKASLAQTSTDTSLRGIFSVLLSCGSLLSMRKAKPQLQIETISKCSMKIWKQCRTSFLTLAESRTSRTDSSWLPEDPVAFFAWEPQAEPAKKEEL